MVWIAMNTNRRKPASTMDARRSTLASVALFAATAGLALGAFGSYAAEWIAAQLDRADVSVKNLHFVTSREGWAVGIVPGSGHVRLETSDGGLTWISEGVSEEDFDILDRSEFLNARDGWAPADRYVWLSDSRQNGHNPGEDNAFDAPVRFRATIDGGRTWTMRQGDIVDVELFGDDAEARKANRKFLSRVHFASPSVGVAAGFMGEYDPDRDATFYRGYVIETTRDGGHTWKAFAYGDVSHCVEPGTGENLIEVIESFGETYAWIPALACQTGILFRTQDAGLSWDAVTLDTPSNILSIGVQILSPTEGIGWGNHWFALTSDRGSSWASPHFGNDVVGFALTSDRGSSWVVDANVSFWAARYVSPTCGWAVGHPEWDGVGEWSEWPRGIYRTTDAGRHWELEGPGLVQVGAISYERAPGVLWAYGTRTLARRVSGSASLSARQHATITWAALKGHEQRR